MQPAARIPLNNGVLMDEVGFGTYKIPPDAAAGLCLDALGAGYRHIDTAALYGNEAGVGEALDSFISGGGAGRSDLFVTSKVWNTDQGYDSTLRAFDASLARLGLDYLDLYLIHWPCPERGLFIDTYRALEALYAEGRVRAIGVSNFQPAHLEQLLDATGIVPAVNQIELHPWLAQEELRQLHQQLGIRTAAWSPLGRGAVLADPVVVRIAAELGRTPAQVILRWHLDLGNIVIPKASTPERIAGNLDLYSFGLTDGHRTALNALDRGQRSGSHPDEVN
ncbi:MULTISPECIES: aldo/keto reductase [unclassified Arthrobacter]|uniref:aldo/keto reductase n=1 Tax=unclassified Arthrobacter TaxID=235627 RepID=UPI001E398208|nr:MULTISPECIES: aldo/keto reductase [unclassified Arthrobacter]MCC9145512.1 aldo/keto reductase [Arthrobacter sp. zg-Y919]MDK1276740.1 aldo/keto reductase [Arthrobacter sp. zg.Y919]WIB04316.1 aldo/keto reductase [Arthrobacter sp. zg-Y919]